MSETYKGTVRYVDWGQGKGPAKNKFGTRAIKPNRVLRAFSYCITLTLTLTLTRTLTLTLTFSYGVNTTQIK